VSGASSNQGGTEAPSTPGRRAPLWQRLLPWAITAACFAYLWFRIDTAAARQGKDAASLLGEVFSRVSWSRLLALMIPYSLSFFLIDSLVLWRVINWFNARVSFLDILPVRASTYILSILNEQLGKGAMAMYLHRREGVPGWQVGSSMLFIMFCEFYYLLAWATVGVLLRWSHLPTEFHVVPAIAAIAALFYLLWIAYFRGAVLPRSTLRDRDLFHAFRKAKPWQYGVVLVLRSPALLIGVVVYTVALRMFGIDMEMSAMLSYVPVVFFGAAVPGPMRSVAIVLWVTLLPDHAAEAAIFGLVMHNFFIFFNAAIGLVFVRRAQREIFGASD
jgi:hypothetical protein